VTARMICFVILFFTDIALAVIAARNIKTPVGSGKVKFGRLMGWLQKEGERVRRSAFREYQPEYTDKSGLLRRFELLYIEKSNIRHYIPFMNVGILILVMFLIFGVTYGPVYKLLEFIPSAAVISGIISIVPLFGLELLSRYNSEVVRRNLSEYMSVLSRWCSVKEDIMYAFEKSLETGIGEPLRSFIRDMVIQVNRGMDPVQALDILQMKVDNAQFRDFIINIKLNMRNRGDIVKLLSNLESQFYKIDEEYNRRRISTYKDRMLIYIIMFGVLAVAYFFINFTPQINAYYLNTMNGKLLLMVFSGLYAFGFYLTAGIMKFKS
jgi:Flp pilus assembly protein TadB